VKAPVVELTASTYLLRREGGSWAIGLIWHERLAGRLPSGGHVELGESLAEAAVREVLEETGLRALLIPGPSAPVPAGFPYASVPAPWWTCNGRTSVDSHTAAEHVHVDHIFLALVDPAAPRPERRLRAERAEHVVVHTAHPHPSRPPTRGEVNGEPRREQSAEPRCPHEHGRRTGGRPRRAAPDPPGQYYPDDTRGWGHHLTLGEIRQQDVTEQGVRSEDGLTVESSMS